jgi:hypothetical protein
MVMRLPQKRIMDPRLPRRAKPREEQRIDDLFLKNVQDALMPQHAAEVVAINTGNGEYVVGQTFHEACEKFLARWPKGPLYICRVDGGPALHLRCRS